MQAKKDHSRIAFTITISAIFIFILTVSHVSAVPYVHYHLDGDGTDASANGLDLTVNEDELTWVEGINGQAVFIKQVENNNPLSMEEMYGTGDWTMEAWVKIDSLDTNQYVIMQAGYLELRYTGASAPRAFGSMNTIYSLPYSFAGRWFHAAVVYRYEQSVQLFINGEKVAENTPNFDFDFTNQHTLYIGKSMWAFTIGEFSIDEVAIHNAALNPEDFIGMQYYVEPTVYAINGHITDSSTGEGLPGVIVNAEPGGYITATDTNGDFTLDFPSGGEFALTFDKTNYSSSSEQGIVVAADNPVTVDTALERVSSSHIVANYHFDGDGKDTSINGYDFIVHNAVTWTDGMWGNAAVLDSLNEIIEYPARPFETQMDKPLNRPNYPGIGDFSCEIVMNFNDLEGRSPMFMFQNNPYGIYTSWYRSVEYQMTVYLDNINNRVALTVPIDDYLNEWIHIAFVYRYKQSFQLFINGELIAEEVTDIVPDIFPGGTFTISAYDRTFIVDEVRISNVALTPEQFLFMETSVEGSPSPSAFSIAGNYPNPFNPSTTIEFTLPETGHVNLSIYNIAGQKIRELASDTMTAGTHTILWDGKDENGMAVPSGMYMSSLVSGENTASNRMILMK